MFLCVPVYRLTPARNGTQVLLSRLDPLQALTGQGSVIASSETEIRISFDEKMDLSEDGWRCVGLLWSLLLVMLADILRLDLFTTDIAYQRMRAAIQVIFFFFQISSSFNLFLHLIEPQ